MMLHLKRVYDTPSPRDGTRILVERLWPRGFTKERAKVDVWLKDVAPSPELRTWFGHDLAKWSDFRRRYLAELKQEPARTALETLRDYLRKGSVTLLYAAHDEAYNSAVVLYRYLQQYAPRLRRAA